MKAPFLTFLGLLVVGNLCADDSGFAWQETAGKHSDLSYNGRNIVRYVSEAMDPERREETYKPFHQVYDSQGENFITKGPGGKFTHHRGIYFGFSKCGIDGTSGTVDTWHCRKAFQLHESVLISEATKEQAHQRVQIAWKKDDGTTFITEERDLVFRMGEGDQLVVDFTSTLSTEVPKVHLDGDPQHAGFQFRASNEVAESTKGQTYYIRPESGKAEMGKTINLGKENRGAANITNLPWKAMSFVVGGERYTTVYLDHPENPKPATYSERDYGRFGSYFVADVTPDKPLEVKYRLVIQKGEVSLENCEALHSAWVK
tara:strand:- start:19757 stop:20704 length:948 start_codon:yes stop_codon:yes gene_type:complete